MIKLLKRGNLGGGLFQKVESCTYSNNGQRQKYDRVLVNDSVCILAKDDNYFYLAKQSRLPVEDNVLEFPAGMLDKKGESPLEVAQRELKEELGIEAETWTDLDYVYSSPGCLTEKCYLFLAEGLSFSEQDLQDNEDIEIIKWPVSDKEGLVKELKDAKSLALLQKAN